LATQRAICARRAHIQQLIDAHQGVPPAWWLADRLGVHPRTVKRDLAALGVRRETPRWTPTPPAQQAVQEAAILRLTSLALLAELQEALRDRRRGRRARLNGHVVRSPRSLVRPTRPLVAAESLAR